MDRTDTAAVFVEVAERGSFADAARRLRRSPAAITRAIAELEARLGVRLLNRTTRAVSVTEAGQRFLAGAKRVLADLDEIERAAAGEGTAPRGELRVTAPILFGRLHVLPIVLEFLDTFPDVSVVLTLLDRPIDLVEEGLDVAVRIGALAESSAIASRVGALHRIVVASPDYLAQHGTPRTPADLGAHAVIAFAGMFGVERWVFHKDADEESVAIVPRLVVTTAEAALDAARAGFGLTRVLSYQAADDIGRGSLRRVLTAYEGDELPVHLSIPADGTRRRNCARSLTSPCRAFAAAARRSGASSIREVASAGESPILPFGWPFFHESGDALFRIARHHVLHHDLRRVAVGIVKAHFELAIERLLADLHHVRRLPGNLAGKRQRRVELASSRNDPVDEADAKRLRRGYQVAGEQHLHRVLACDVARQRRPWVSSRTGRR